MTDEKAPSPPGLLCALCAFWVLLISIVIPWWSMPYDALTAWVEGSKLSSVLGISAMWPWFGPVTAAVLFVATYLFFTKPQFNRVVGIMVVVFSATNLYMGLGGIAVGIAGIVVGVIGIFYKPS